MNSSAHLTFYKSYQNKLAIKIMDENNQEFADHSTITRIVMSTGLDGVFNQSQTQSIDSDVEPSVFDLTKPEAIYILGGLTSVLSRGRYFCKITAYTAALTSGVAQDPTYVVTVE